MPRIMTTLYHKRMGHFSEASIDATIESRSYEQNMKGLRESAKDFCEICIILNLEDESTEHTDICGPFRTYSKGRNQYLEHFLL